jgi:hypothetical protein
MCYIWSNTVQQTIDLLREELVIVTGNYTQSLEREKELRASSLSREESYASTAKCLAALRRLFFISIELR